MTKRFLSAVSVLGLLTGSPAMADTTNSGNSFEEGWESTKEAAQNAGEVIENTAGEAYAEINAFFFEDQNERRSTVIINQPQTAAGVIGSPVYSNDGERVAKVEDIILNKEGEAMLVVLADGDFTGFGKRVAFDYDIITKTSSNGDIVVPLTEEGISQATPFSYESGRGAEKNTRSIPDNAISINELLDAQLVSHQGEHLGEVDNLTLRDGRATHLVLTYGGLLGLGEHQVAIDFDAADIKRNGEEYDFQVNAQKAAKFDAFKETSMRN